MKGASEVIAILLLILACAAISPVAARTIYVDASSQGIEDGSAAHPYRTIEPAIALADIGDSVAIAAGTYQPADQALRLKPGVTLSGSSAESCTISGDIVDDDSSSGVSVGVLNLTFGTFRFVRGPSIGPFTGITTIANCVCDAIVIDHGQTFDSIGFTSHSFVIEGNAVAGVIRFAQGAVFGGNATIRDNACAGIEIDHAGSPDTSDFHSFGASVTDNVVSGTIFFGQGAGAEEDVIRGNSAGTIVLESGAFWTYDVSDNQVDSGIVDRSGVCRTTIAHNTVLDGVIIDESGSYYDGTENEIIEDNTVNYSGRKLTFNHVSPERITAAVINRSGNATLQNNDITSAISGCDFSSGGPTNIRDNTIVVPTLSFPFSPADSTVYGIITVAGGGDVTGNTIRGGFIGYYSSSGAFTFGQNTVSDAHIGVFTTGLERVRGNIISDCTGDGLVMPGAKGPVELNRIVHNAGSGIRLEVTNVDLGGGKDGSAGQNILQGNGNYGLYIATALDSTDTIYARHNYWDHVTADDIRTFDIHDGMDVDSLPVVVFQPFGVSSIDVREAASHLPRITVYPNPIADIATCAYHTSRPGHVTMRVIDNLGRVVSPLLDLVQDRGDYSVQIRRSALNASPGLYWIELMIDEQHVTAPLVVR